MRHVTRPILTGVATIAAAVSVLAGPMVGVGTATTSAVSSQIVTISPGANLSAQLAALRPGDVLMVNPGTYVVHTVRPVLTRGTATAPIIVRAADPANPPLIQGDVRLWGPSYWVLDGLRIQAIDPGTDALDIFGGTGWIVRNSEVFGALNTNGYANVAIATDTTTGTGAPSRFWFEFNCVHDAARSGRAAHTDHNMYVNFAGNATSGGVIQNNVIYGAYNGAGIKLGNGGAATDPGPWGVQVLRNTISNGGRQILLTGEVRNNVIAGNLLAYSTQGFTANPATTLIYVNMVGNSTNLVGHNYGYAANMFSWGSTVRLTADDGMRPNPGFTSVSSCSGYHTTYANAAAYGRYGAGSWPVW
jgi:hypothetical protein